MIQKCRDHLQILGPWKVTWSKVRTNDPQTLVAMATWRPEFAHPCHYAFSLTYINTYVYIYIYIYNIYRVSQEERAKLREGVLLLNYTDITQNTYVQSWTVTEIKAREKCGLFAVPRGSCDVIPIRCAMSVLVYSWLKRVPCCDCTCKVLGNPKDNYDVSASVFVVQFNGFMSLTS